ncbi:hypothetical protein [Polynucleobacter sp. UK-Kesae-W10]|uniref:hypothetical protein n=1 Tax=Polynucleobacter sp. UK-Kesae-W10 TaxID=1819738 RepID=UPI001C0E8EF6|nr:hypothetical protein [Polynucleobacter sp. UK-Kesae-W10]MBU3576915.1 hypothetical protein [Polynucleobacter sp. UK-Kesae-W10]
MKKTLLVVVTSLVLTNSAMAAGSFDGINTQLGVGFGQLSSNSDSFTDNYSDPGNSYTSRGTQSYNTSGNANVFGTASIGYSYGFTSKFNLAANAFYLGGSSNAGSSTYLSTTNYPTTSSGSNNVTLKNIFGVVVEPGYYFGDKSLAFLKAGIAQATAGINGFQSYNYSNNSGPIGSINYNASSNVQGVLYGLGFKQLITEQVYVGFEAYQIQFANKSFSTAYSDSMGKGTQSTTIKPLASFAGVTLGYKF